MPRHGNVQHDFYRTTFLPLEIDLSHGNFFLLQPVIQARKIAFAVCQTDHELGNLHFFAPLDTAQQLSMRAVAVIPAAPTIGRKPYEETSVISAAPSETIMCVREPAPFMRVCRSATISRTRQII